VPAVRRVSSSPPARAQSSAPPPKPGAAAAARAAASSPSDDELVAQGRAVRVAVKRSALDGALYVVRPLGERVPTGARAALLILSEPDPAFFASSGNKSTADA
jgi:hypothetical protein